MAALQFQLCVGIVTLAGCEAGARLAFTCFGEPKLLLGLSQLRFSRVNQRLQRTHSVLAGGHAGAQRSLLPGHFSLVGGQLRPSQRACAALCLHALQVQLQFAAARVGILLRAFHHSQFGELDVEQLGRILAVKFEQLRGEDARGVLGSCQRGSQLLQLQFACAAGARQARLLFIQRCQLGAYQLQCRLSACAGGAAVCYFLLCALLCLLGGVACVARGQRSLLRCLKRAGLLRGLLCAARQFLCGVCSAFGQLAGFACQGQSCAALRDAHHNHAIGRV